MASARYITGMVVCFILVALLAPMAMEHITADNGSTWGNDDAASIWSEIIPVIAVISFAGFFLKGVFIAYVGKMRDIGLFR